MAWEYLDEVDELSGNPGELTDSSQSWERILEIVNSGSYGIPYTTGENYTAGSGDFYFPGGETQEKVTSWGLSLNFEDSRELAIGGFDFKSNVPVPGSSGGYYGYSLGGLLYYGGFRILVNHELEELMVALVRVFYNSPYYTTVDILGGDSGITHEIKKILYDFVMAHTPSPISWETVHNIYGKDKTYRLTDILNINNGEAVENESSKGNLDFSKKTKVNTLVEAAVESESDMDITKATVKYDIPEGNYQYTKIVYKKKKIPKSDTDGTAVTISMDDNKVLVRNLDPDTTYYFVVFTNKTRSEAYKYRTGSAPVVNIMLFQSTVMISRGLKEIDFTEIVGYERQ